MSNIIHVDFSNNTRTILTPRQRLVCSNQIIPFRAADTRNLANARYELMSDMGDANENYKRLQDHIYGRLTDKQWSKMMRGRTYMERLDIVKTVSKSTKLHLLVDQCKESYDLYIGLCEEYEAITDKLEEAGYWKDAQ